MESIGQVFHGRYRLTRLLDRGGMGVVWCAEDTKLHRLVALKFLPELVVHNREAMAELAAETRRCLELTHPHIVRVYDLVEAPAQAAISMEFVDGPSLADRKRREPSRCFNPEVLAPWMAQLCSALDYAHTKAHIVHRDLKPQNLLVNAAGELKVVDFGIARSLRSSETRVTLPTRGLAATLGYAGPQQLLGEPAAVTDDIYSLGATLYDLLTGRPPFFEGDISLQVREVVPPSIAARRAGLGLEDRGSIPAIWEETVAACLAKRAADRPQSATEVATRLGLVLPGATVRTRTPVSITDTRPPTASLPPPPPAAPARPSWRGPGLGALAVLAVLAAGLFLRPSAPPAPAPIPAPTSPAEFVVQIDPPVAGAHASIGARADLAVPENGRLVVGDLPDGDHELKVEAPGHRATMTRVAVRQGRGTATVKLGRAYGLLAITARPGTTVTALDERGQNHAVGTVAADGQLRVEDRLPVGTYTLRLTHPDCGDVEQPGVVVAADRPATIAPAQAPRPGQLRILSQPAGAEVAIDGAAAGFTPLILTAQPSEQRLDLTLTLPGHRRFTQTVTLRPGEQRTVDAGTLIRIPRPQVGRPWTVPALGLVLQPIAPGSFSMGSTRGNKEETPVTPVTLKRPFWIGKTEVSQQEWQAVMGSSNPSEFKGDTLPVHNVSWNEAMEFCRKLTARERAADRLPPGYAYTLPTEAQWEYACRAGSSEDTAEALDELAWHLGNSAGIVHAVGEKQPNAWGLHDMRGNVWEWCADWFADRLPGSEVTDPTGPAKGDARVRRGGSILVDAHHLRPSFRGLGRSSERRANIGFRVALVPAP